MDQSQDEDHEDQNNPEKENFEQNQHRKTLKNLEEMETDWEQEDTFVILGYVY